MARTYLVFGDIESKREGARPGLVIYGAEAQNARFTVAFAPGRSPASQDSAPPNA